MGKKTIVNPITGDSDSICGWAARLGISTHAFSERVRFGMPPERMFKSGRSDRVTIEKDGKQMTAADILPMCRWIGATIRAVTKRIKAGWDFEDIIIRPKNSHGRVFVIRGTAMTLKDVSKLAGVPYATMRRRCKDSRYVRDEDILVKLPKRTASNDFHSTRSPILEFAGERHTLSVWSKMTGIKRDTIAYRLKAGWDVEAALTKLPWARSPITGEPIKDMEFECGVTPRIVANRVYCGWSFEKASNTPKIDNTENISWYNADRRTRRVRSQLAMLGVMI